MSIQEELSISGYQLTVGYPATEIGEIFKLWLEEYGENNIFFICSCAYNLGKAHGKREERARRKKKVS